MAKTDIDDRTAFEAAFEEAPRAQLPAAVQQIVMDDRPRGAVSVAVKRDEAEVLRKIKIVASAAGDAFFYSWPTKNRDGSMGEVAGPSVKCANAVSRIFGNCQVQVRPFDQGTHWILHARFYDLETGYIYERPYQQRKGQNVGGKMDADRAADMIFQIGVSKAARNVVCNALSEFTDYAFAIAREQLVEKIGKNLPRYLERVISRLAELEVDIVRVEKVRGKPSASWVAVDVAKIIAEIQAIADGMSHPEEIWPLAQVEPGAARPKPEDFKPKGEQAGMTVREKYEPGIGDRENAAAVKETSASPVQASADAKPAGAAAAAGEGQGSAPAPASGPAKGETAPAAEKTAETAKSTDRTETAPETAQDGQGAAAAADDPAIDEIPAGDDDEQRMQAFDRGERMLEGLVELLPEFTADKPEDLAEYDERGKTAIREFEGLDDEDRAVLLGRWNTKVLEHKRSLGGRGRGKRR